MDENAVEFYHDFRQGLAADADSSGEFLLTEFVSAMATVLEDNGFADSIEICHYRAERGMRVDGYCLDDEGLLSLVVADFDNRKHLESISRTEILQAFKRLATFFTASLEKGLYEKLEEASQGYQLARLIYDRREYIRKVDMHLLTERVVSTRVQELEGPSVDGTPVSYSVWDISRLQRIEQSRGKKEPVDIDLREGDGVGLQCIPAHLASDQYESYLVVVPGERLSGLYEKFGARLLEQNVRTFLQARGKVNKGIQSTILNEPHMFFAYNNGITATAEQVETSTTEQGLMLTKIRDLQIVNGGQTTASLFHTARKYKKPLTDVFVQMKLSVIDPERSEEVVPRISEYANTQNRVNAADFFSNHPFHVRIESYSRRIWAPAAEGQLRETKWFYERARGQYADAQSRLTPAERRRFKAECPKSQMFTKTDLAKFENVWDEHPRWVNLGAQKNFSRYAERIGKLWEKDPHSVNEFYFHRIVARAIVFRRTEKLVSAQPWYDGGYRANIVAYTLASISRLASSYERPFDYEAIWRRQAISETTEATIVIAAAFVNNYLVNPPAGISNISEWAKQAACWDRICEGFDALAARIPASFVDDLADGETLREQKAEAKKVRKVDEGIEAQKRVVSIPAKEWKRICQLAQAMNLLTDKEDSILRIACSIPNRIPTEAQSNVLLAMLARLESEGITIKQ